MVEQLVNYLAKQNTTTITVILTLLPMQDNANTK